MRFFHVSDLHLGKALRGYDLLDDQAFVLDGLAGKIRGAKPDALLIAGDVYDRAVPPVEAIALFDAFLRSARAAAPGLQIVVIPGNHDSAGRLSFGASLLADSGLHIAARAGGEPLLMAGEGAGRTAIWALPFLTQASVTQAEPAEAGPSDTTRAETDGRGSSGPSIRSQQELMRLAIDRIGPAMDRRAANILVAHCFAAGARAGDSETAFVGAAEQVDASLFEGFDYVALGHLHSCQSHAPRVWYSGAPLAYSAGEAGTEKGFLSVEVFAGEAPRIEFVPLVPKRRVRRLSGCFAELLANPLPEAERDDYVEVYICDEEPVLGAIDRLKALYPRLLGAPQRAYEQRLGDAGDAALDALRRARGSADAPDRLETVREDFLSFHKEMTGEDPSEGTVVLFDAIAREAADASD